MQTDESKGRQVGTFPICVHPALRAILDAAQGRPGLADMPVEQARALIERRTASRPRGPYVDEVRSFAVPGVRGPIPLRLYRPKHAGGVAVVFHGGGWLMGGLDSFDATSRHLAIDSGLAVISVDYRLAPEFPFPAALEDAWAATQWVHTHPDELGADCSRMAVLGESAGGNLAASVCLLARDSGMSAIKLQVLVYASVDARLEIDSLRQFEQGYLQSARDVEYAFRTYGLGSVVSADDWRLSPLLAQSHRGLPPALLISAGLDGVRDDSFAYAARLLEAGVPATHVCYPAMVHTFFGMRGIVPDAELAQKQAAIAMRDAVQAQMQQAYESNG